MYTATNKWTHLRAVAYRMLCLTNLDCTFAVDTLRSEGYVSAPTTSAKALSAP